MDAISPTISAICRFPNFEGSPGGLDGGTKSMKSNRGMPYDVCAIKARDCSNRKLIHPFVIAKRDLCMCQSTKSDI